MFALTFTNPPIKDIRLLLPSRDIPAGMDPAECDFVDSADGSGFFTGEKLAIFDSEARRRSLLDDDSASTPSIASATRPRFKLLWERLCCRRANSSLSREGLPRDPLLKGRFPVDSLFATGIFSKRQRLDGGHAECGLCS